MARWFRRMARFKTRIMNNIQEVSDQFKRGLKDELLDTADKKYKEAKKKKTYRKVMEVGKKAKEKLKDPKGIRGTHKGKWGYYKGGKFKSD